MNHHPRLEQIRAPPEIVVVRVKQTRRPRTGRAAGPRRKLRSMTTTVTPDGIELAYEVTGGGPPLALVHGITESRRSWDPLLPRLAERHRVIAVDLRGHGESGSAPSYDLVAMAQDLRHVLSVENATDAVLTGHSLGGTVVTAYASAYPTRAVVNIDQSLALGAFRDGLKQVEPMLRGDEPGFQSLISMIFDSMMGALSETERSRVRNIRRPVQPVVLGVWSALLDSTPEELDQLVRTGFSEIKAPYLAIHGIDPGAGYSEWLHSIVPSALCEVWPDLGHYPHLVETERFITRLAEFEASL